MSESETRIEANEVTNPAVRMCVAAETMRTVVGVVRAVVDECRVHLEADGFHVAAVDPAAVASVSVDVGTDAFETYEGEGGVIGLDLERLSDVLSVADRDQLVELALDAETRKLHVAIGELDYTMALIDPEAIRSPPDVSAVDFEFTADAVVRTEDVARFVRAADMVSTHLGMGVDDAEDALYVEATGDTDDVSLVVPAEDLVDLTPGAAHSLFSVDFLKDLSRAIPRDSDVRLRLGNDMPLELRYDVADGAGTVEGFLSPRIVTS